MRAIARRIGATACFLGVLLTSCADRSETENRANGANSRVCDLLTKMTTADSRMDGNDLASMRAQVPALAELSTELAAVAPEAIRAEAEVVRESIKLWRSIIAAPDLVLKENTSYLWATDETVAAGEELRQWGVDNCDEPLDREALEQVTLLVCLPEGSKSNDVQALFSRVHTPSTTGRGNVLLEGITGVGARERAIAVELDPLITPERKGELLAILSSPPVESVLPDTDTCD